MEKTLELICEALSNKKGVLIKILDVKDLTSIQDALSELGKTLGVEIRAQHADIFLSMHRVG